MNKFYGIHHTQNAAGIVFFLGSILPPQHSCIPCLLNVHVCPGECVIGNKNVCANLHVCAFKTRKAKFNTVTTKFVLDLSQQVTW